MRFMRRPLPFAFFACLAAAAVLAPSRPARAGIFIGAEFDAGQGIGMPASTHPGYGFIGALGYRIGLGPIFLQPEAQGGYVLFPADLGQGMHVARVLGGFRLGLAGKVQPAIFGHAGIGWLDTYTSGSALDAGISLAFKLVPLFSFGAQAAYNVVSVADTSPQAPGAATKWLSYGVHAAIDF
jgi:hypothetical protein